MQEARHVREQLKSEMRMGVEKMPRSTTTLADYSEQWIEAAAKRLKPSTLSLYTKTLAQKILPKLGEYRLGMITRQDVDAWARGVEEERFESDGEFIRYSTDTLRTWWRVLLQILRDAHAEGHIKNDPTLRVPAPETKVRKRRESRTLSALELVALLEATPDARRAEVACLAWTGMRPGEMYALTWQDIDFERERLVVARAVWRGHIGTTKTDASREVPLADELRVILQDHRESQRLAVGEDWAATNLVFPSEAGTTRTAASLQKALALARAVANIDQHVSPQVLRRTWNTLLDAAGVNHIVIRSMLGHSSEEMTQRYAGIRMERKHEAIAKVLKLADG